MGASLGTGKDGLNVELNVVPFIDLMSCLTAFLLVTAVWSSYAQIEISPKGIGQEGNEEPRLAISVLLTKSEIWVGLSDGERLQLRNEGGHYDWAALEDTLKGYRELKELAGRRDIEIAAEDEVEYQSVISAMDYAISSRFPDIGYVDPASLSIRFRE